MPPPGSLADVAIHVRDPVKSPADAEASSRQGVLKTGNSEEAKEGRVILSEVGVGTLGCKATLISTQPALRLFAMEGHTAIEGGSVLVLGGDLVRGIGGGILYAAEIAPLGGNVGMNPADQAGRGCGHEDIAIDCILY